MSKGIDDYDTDWFVDIDNQFDTVNTKQRNLPVWKTSLFKSDKVNKNAQVTFMGDSSLDCKLYTGTGKGTVDYLIDSFNANDKDKYAKLINDISVDGYEVADCISDTNKVYGNAVVISVTGNDLLARIPLLAVSKDTNITMGIINSELDKLEQAYDTLLHQLRKGGRKFLLLTCYTGNLAYNPQRFNGIDNVGHSIVSMWNDRLYRIANKHSNSNNSIGQQFDVLELRNFMTPNCYYNEIEPNEIGAKRIAKHVNKWLFRNGVWS